MEARSERCHVCGRYIPPADFKSLRAVVLLKRRYCRDCTDAITAGASASTASSATHRKVTTLAGLFSHGGRRS